MMIVQQNPSPFSSGVNVALLSKKDTGLLALPSAYCPPMTGLYQYLDCIREERCMDASMELDSSSFIYEMQDLISPDLISPKMLAGLTEGNF